MIRKRIAIALGILAITGGIITAQASAAYQYFKAGSTYCLAQWSVPSPHVNCGNPAVNLGSFLYGDGRWFDPTYPQGYYYNSNTLRTDVWTVFGTGGYRLQCIRRYTTRVVCMAPNSLYPQQHLMR